MARRRLLQLVFPSYLIIALVPLFAVVWHGSSSMRRIYLDHVRADLLSTARLVEQIVDEDLAAGRSAIIDSACAAISRATGKRITVLAADGRVVADSEAEPSAMDVHDDRIELVSALRGEPSTSVRYSRTVDDNLIYGAVPVMAGATVIGAVRAAVRQAEINDALRPLYVEMAVGMLLTLVLSAGAGYFIARRITEPVRQLREGAARFARGELKAKLPAPELAEMGALADTMNQMASQLDERMGTVLRQRNELEAVLSSMVEGVLAVDTDERIIRINRAAAGLIDMEPAKAQGKNVLEVVRNSDLQRFITWTLASSDPVESEIVIYKDGSDTSLQAHGTALRGAPGQQNIGALIVLNDVTLLRRLEGIRRDFVANVSHELRTPITSIKGFVETLQDGALDNRDDARRFLDIIAKQADRLNAIIEDLLSLSRIEQETERAEIAVEKVKLKGVLRAASQSCELQASEKGIELELACAEDLCAQVNAQLIEQAVINLVDNAVKYSDRGDTVRVSCRRTDLEVVISVEDHGAGIPEEHLARLFERFYRVDKARSRKLGGTGLGLAIVKHIAQVHEGHASVESTVGRGSTFSIHLPRR